MAMEEKNGQYFLKILKVEVDKLVQLAGIAERELQDEENVPEEACGRLRAAAGKARLLVRQKLAQFESLCRQNMTRSSEDKFPVTNDDLAGFWDMVMIQVVQVYAIFDELETLKQNSWKALSSPMLKGDGTKKSSLKVAKNLPKEGARRLQPVSVPK